VLLEIFMEGLVARLLPLRLQPFLVRSAISTAIVLMSALLRMGLHPHLQDHSFILFVPAVFLSSLLFDRPTGYWATMLATVMAIGVFTEPYYRFVVREDDVIPLALFVGTCVGLVEVTEALRRVLERVMRAEQENALLLQELDHRSRNNLQMIASVLTLQASSSTEPAVQAALKGAVARVRVIARAHNRLQKQDSLGEVRLDEYLDDLCQALGEVLRDVQPIAVIVAAEPLQVPTSVAIPVGLLANELVTNAFKYAFPGDLVGTIRVSLRQSGSGWAELVVEDDGAGYAPNGQEGLGTRLTMLLARQLNGTIERGAVEAGCRVVARFPIASL
jgi:two-component sensor histidine kinase